MEQFLEGISGLQTVAAFVILIVTFWAGQRTSAKKEGEAMARVETRLDNICEDMGELKNMISDQTRRLEVKIDINSTDISKLKSDVALLMTANADNKKAHQRMHDRLDEFGAKQSRIRGKRGVPP